MLTSDRGRRWAVPGTGLALGGLICLTAGLQGQWVLGLAMLGIMVVYSAAMLAFGGREPIAMLARDDGDERQRLIRQRASSFSLNVVAVVVVGGFIVDLARGGDGMPWALLGAVGGASFVGALVVQSRRG